MVDDGDELGVAVSARGARPRRAGSKRGLPPGWQPAGRKRVAMVLSAYPTKRSRIGNAVGLDTPASLLAVLDALRAAGYDVAPVGEDPDAVMTRLADGLSYDVDVLTGPAGHGRRPAACRRLRHLVRDLPAALRHAVESTWGPAPARCASTTTT